MERKRDELQRIDFINNNHSIIYAPNSTGKTRLTNKLSRQFENEPSMFLTAKRIGDMLSFTGRQMFVGANSHLRVENENIIKEFNSVKYSDEILKYYESKNALSLSKASSLFNIIQLKKKDTFDMYSKLFEFIGDRIVPKDNVSFENLILIDKKLSKIDLVAISDIAKNSVIKATNNGTKIISEELKKELEDIAESIGSRELSCPLCGTVFSTNHILKESIKKHLDGFVIDSWARNYEHCIAFLNLLDALNQMLGYRLFDTLYEDEITTTLLLNNIAIIDNVLLLLASKILTRISNSNSRELFLLYVQNQKIIEKENESRANNSEFYSEVISILQNFVTLPDGFHFITKGEKISIIDDKAKIVAPEDFLSESEQKRMCISIVYAEIKQRNLKYVVFDDPVDSNDDYYFDVSVNAIADMVFSHSNINWIILTHEFRMISILSGISRSSSDLFVKTAKYMFYLPDPSFNGGGLPPFNLIAMQADDLLFLSEHETIIFSKIFEGIKGYQCDKDLALLSSFNTARNLYNEILNNHRISNHKTKKLGACISTGSKSYEHYRNKRTRIMRMSTLYVMNRTMYLSCSTSYSTNSKAYAANNRMKYVKNRNYLSIKCDNEVLKYILFTMVRVMNSHYLFEKKLAIWAANNFGSSFSYSKFEREAMLYNKLDYVNGLCSSTDMILFNKFQKCFLKWRGLLNDFAHSTSRMVPPYLTVGPVELSKLENDIGAL